MKRLISIGLILALLFGSGVICEFQGSVALASESVISQTKATPASAVSITASTRTLKVGESTLLTASVLPSGATQGVTWYNSDKSIIQSELGPGNKGYLITGLAPGKATVKAVCKTDTSLSASIEITVNSSSPGQSTSSWELLYSSFISKDLIYDGYGSYYVGSDDGDYFEYLSLADFNMDGTPELILKDYSGCSNVMYTISNGNVRRYAKIKHINKLYLYRVKSSKRYMFISDCTVGDACVKRITEWSGTTSKVRFSINEETDGKRRKFYYVGGKKVSNSTYKAKLKAYWKKVSLITSYPNYKLGSSKMTAFQKAVTDYKVLVNQGKVPK